MHDLHLLEDLAVALAGALVGGLVARLLRFPTLIGFIAAGVALGPYTPGIFADSHAVTAIAKIGVVLLMFAVGVQFSLEELRAVRRTALIGGGLQLLLTIGLGFALSHWLGWGAYPGLFVGCALALSSTAVMLRLLEDRGELGSAHGSAMVGILIVQDLAVVVMALLLPALATLGSGGSAALADVGLSLLRAGVSLGVTLFLALKGVPFLLEHLARTRSRELFLLAVVCICLAAGYLAHLAGFSLEIGAFLAGLVISESDYAHEVFSQVRPLRDVFASLFFVSMGMLLDPRFVALHWLEVTAVVLAIVLGKGLIAAAAVYLAGHHGRTAILAGLGLAQIGEFSFVLVGIATERSLVAPEVTAVIVTSALVTLLLAPLVYGAAGPLYGRMLRFPGMAPVLNRRPRESRTHEPRVEAAGAQALVVGGGRVGSQVSATLSEYGVRHVVVEYDAIARNRLRARGVPVVYGDATSETVLRKALSPSLRLAVVALPEAESTRMVVRTLKELAPELQVLARVHRASDLREVRRAGADAVIHAEFEAAAGLILEALAVLEFDPGDVQRHLAELRDTRCDLPGGAAQAPSQTKAS